MRLNITQILIHSNRKPDVLDQGSFTLCIFLKIFLRRSFRVTLTYLHTYSCIYSFIKYHFATLVQMAIVMYNKVHNCEEPSKSGTKDGLKSIQLECTFNIAFHS